MSVRRAWYKLIFLPATDLVTSASLLPSVESHPDMIEAREKLMSQRSAEMTRKISVRPGLERDFDSLGVFINASIGVPVNW